MGVQATVYLGRARPILVLKRRRSLIPSVLTGKATTTVGRSGNELLLLERSLLQHQLLHSRSHHLGKRRRLTSPRVGRVQAASRSFIAKVDGCTMSKMPFAESMPALGVVQCSHRPRDFESTRRMLTANLGRTNRRRSRR
jgi:hypothetical protein